MVVSSAKKKKKDYSMNFLLNEFYYYNMRYLMCCGVFYECVLGRKEAGERFLRRAESVLDSLECGLRPDYLRLRVKLNMMFGRREFEEG